MLFLSNNYGEATYRFELQVRHQLLLLLRFILLQRWRIGMKNPSNFQKF